tara:strand:+ start:258 stop:404 length:147 start_codon:yes stop_codon:yes gene_type:complete
MLDTLKTSGTGLGTSVVICLEVLPEIVSILVGLTTIVYLIVKIRKELK